MSESASALSSRANFYVIVGSSGGALIGLQFVVITLIADRRPGITSNASVSAFGTPTVVHLGAALLVSAIMSIPWPSLGLLSVVLCGLGLGGLAYGAIVIRRARRQTDYEPVWGDWLWHAVLPMVSYAAILVSAAILRAHPQRASFVIGTGALGLLFIGIHNAWDSVTHLVVSNARGDTGKKE